MYRLTHEQWAMVIIGSIFSFILLFSTYYRPNRYITDGSYGVVNVTVHGYHFYRNATVGMGFVMDFATCSIVDDADYHNILYRCKFYGVER